MCARACVSFSLNGFLTYPCTYQRSQHRFSNPPLMSVPSEPELISRQHQSSPCDLQTDSSITSTCTPLLLISVSSACQRQCYYILKLRGLLTTLKFSFKAPYLKQKAACSCGMGVEVLWGLRRPSFCCRSIPKTLFASGVGKDAHTCVCLFPFLWELGPANITMCEGDQ